MKQPEYLPVGQRHGRLVVTGEAPRAKGGKAQVYCDCDCGTKAKVVRVSALRSGVSTSCGCFAREQTSARSRTHGMTKTPEWATWRRIINRCENPNMESFAHYGAKGIRVCDRWRSSFVAFFEDMGAMPKDKPTIDRIDNSKGYEPGNCRWADVTEQNRNKTSNTKVTHDGRCMTVAEWAREMGMSHSGLADRLKTMSVNDAMTLPDQRGQRRWRTAV